MLELTETKGGAVNYVTEAALEERLKRHTEELTRDVRTMIDSSIVTVVQRQDRMTDNIEQLAKAAMTMAAAVSERMEDVATKLDRIDSRSDERHKETVDRLEKMSAEVASWTAFRRTAVTFAQLVAALPVADFLKKLVAGLARLIGWLSVIGGSVAFGAWLGSLLVSIVR